MDKEKELEKLNKEIRNCRKCLLYKERKNAVPGEGPANARIMAIGQAPGREEDRTGRPFIGRAGKLLTWLLEIAGIKREKVFITSVAKCFPPGNRKPSEKEIAASLPYLKKQINIINPRRIILLGDVAFSVFFPGKKMGQFRGKIMKKDSRDFFISYHPAAGIRFVKFKKILEKDFKKLRAIKF
ncbi:MAG: uracil-DNA glycosylase [Patescibacteria group bacterium]